MADEAEDHDDGHYVPTLQIWGSGINHHTGEATLFLVTGATRLRDGEPTGSDDMIARSEFVIVLDHELVHFAQGILKQAHTEMVQWELEREARAKLN